MVVGEVQGVAVVATSLAGGRSYGDACDKKRAETGLVVSGQGMKRARCTDRRCWSNLCDPTT